MRLTTSSQLCLNIEGFLVEYITKPFNILHWAFPKDNESMSWISESWFWTVWLNLFLIRAILSNGLAQDIAVWAELRWGLHLYVTFMTPVLLNISLTDSHKLFCRVWRTLLSFTGNTSQVSVHRHSIPNLQIKNSSKEIHDRLVLFIYVHSWSEIRWKAFLYKMGSQYIFVSLYYLKCQS